MKNIKFLAVSAVVAMSFASCNSGSGYNKDLEQVGSDSILVEGYTAESMDSVYRAIGFEFGTQFNKLGIKDINEKEYLSGIKDAINEKDLKLKPEEMQKFMQELMTKLQGGSDKVTLSDDEIEKFSYSMGAQMGLNFSVNGLKDLNFTKIVSVMKNVVTGGDAGIEAEEAGKIESRFFMVFNEKMRKESEEKGKVAKEEGEKFLEENSKKEGVVTLPSGLQYQILKKGSGKKPAATDTVVCHYVGQLVNGQEFDNSVKRGEPVTFALDKVIKGWTEGLQLMQEGSKYRLFVPYQLAYGEYGSYPTILPYSALIFDVELIEVK